MTLNNVFDIGVSGLLAQSHRISTISDNISNVNTVGFKGSTADFLALVQSAGNAVLDSRNGARAVARQHNAIQGEILPTDTITNMAINGDGFFPVAEDNFIGSPLRFTRAGAFSPDKDGNMRNSAGFYLKGWALDATGALPAALQTAAYDSGTAINNLSLVNIAATDSVSVPSSVVSIKANLNADQTLYNPAGNIEFTNNPSAGDTITINGVVWTFVASGATGNQTNIGADLDRTMSNLADDLNASADPLLTPATYSNIAGNKLGIVYDAINAGASTFSFSSGSPNGVATPLLLYDAALATNNMTGGGINSNFNRTVGIIDNNGVEHQVNILFLKTAVNSWAVELSATPATDITTAGGQIAAGTLVFNGDGSLASISPSLSDPIVFPWASTGTIPTGATTATVDNTVTFDWGTAGAIFGTIGATSIGRADGVRQLSGDYKVDELTQNGHTAGSLQSIEITDTGIIKGIYSNGTSQDLFVLPIAKFYNADGLENVSGTAYLDSDIAGFINLFSAGSSGVGKIIASGLEQSVVDLPTQMADIIVAQRAYQANTKTVSTSDEMMRTLTDMLR